MMSKITLGELTYVINQEPINQHKADDLRFLANLVKFASAVIVPFWIMQIIGKFPWRKDLERRDQKL